MKRRDFLKTTTTALVGGMLAPSFGLAPSHASAPVHKIWVTPRQSYKCLYNIESLMHCDNDISSKKIKWVVEKLAGTDVDAIMCCPTAWRTNIFPSDVDPEWKKFTHIRNRPGFEPFDYVMKYMHDGGDPVRDQLEATRAIGADFFISYRMNDWHNIQDVHFPTHNAFWREHPDYWLGNTNAMGWSDKVRLFNYGIPAVRDHYHAIIEELCTRYDLDGVELDFQRIPRFFYDREIGQGMPLMTDFVKRIRRMLDRIGADRGKKLKLCVRIPGSITACEKVGLDVVGWNASGSIDMINLSPFFFNSLEIDIEGVMAKIKRAKVFGEMNMLYAQTMPRTKGSVNEINAATFHRYTTLEMYRATAMNFLRRGADGLSVFNLDYVDGDCFNSKVSRLEYPLKRLAMVEMLRGITDLKFLENKSKDYALYPNGMLSNPLFPAKNKKTFQLFVADDTSKVRFTRSVLRVETKEDCTGLPIDGYLNGQSLNACVTTDTELFEPVHRNKGFAGREKLKFFSVPLDRLIPGNNNIVLINQDRKRTPCTFFSVELALYQ